MLATCSRYLFSSLLLAVTLLAGCGSVEEKTPSREAPAAAAPAAALPYEQAVRKATLDLLANANLAKDRRYEVVVDPLVDGNSGVQSEATAAMEQTVVQLIRDNYQQVEVRPFTTEAVSGLPLLMIGTFTPINLQGKADGERDAYRICFALADLKTGKIVSKGLARSLPEGFDATPLPFFRELPVWAKDGVTEGYIRTCQGTKAGDPINPAYIDTILAASTINEAMRAYHARRFKDSLALYQSVLTNPAGNQARVHAGIYLNNQQLGRQQAALKAFGKLAEIGLANDRLAVQFDFRPGATGFVERQRQYSQWLGEIGRQSIRQSACLEVAAHTRRGVSEQMDQRLSEQRAEFVRQKLIAVQPAMARRTSAKGYGAQRLVVGTGKGNQSDALDQRVEFKRVSC